MSNEEQVKGVVGVALTILEIKKQAKIEGWNEALEKVIEAIDLVTDKEDNQADATYLKREVKSLRKKE